MNDIATYIGVGHENGKTLGELSTLLGMPERLVRKYISESDELIINLQDGRGYFKPDINEVLLVQEWIFLMGSRVKHINSRVYKARSWMSLRR